MKRIHHFIINKSEDLFSLLARELPLSKEQIQFLLHLGAIYQNGERILKNHLLHKGDVIRCHTEPRRFRRDFEWNKHILFEDEDFILIDKPFGLPCQASLDNKIENVLNLLSQFYQQNLFITHRLDVGTEGLMILAKNKSFQKNFNQLLESRNIIKGYECLTTGSQLSPSHLTHWMRPNPRAPKVLSATCGEKETQEHWKQCDLEILESEKINVKWHPILSHPTLLPDRINYYRLQLHTGRTHQIRAQLSFESNPILGDPLYGGIKNREHEFEQYALRCCELKFQMHGSLFHWERLQIKNGYI